MTSDMVDGYIPSKLVQEDMEASWGPDGHQVQEKEDNDVL